MRFRPRAASLPALVLVVACVSSTNAEDCDVFFGGHGGSGVPFDAGNGVIANEGDDFQADIGESLNLLQLTDCASGDRMQIVYRLVQADDQNVRKVVVSDEEYPEFKEQILGRVDRDDFDDIAANAEARGFFVGQIVFYESDTAETCGCAALYPRLRGDKEPYEAQL